MKGFFGTGGSFNVQGSVEVREFEAISRRCFELGILDRPEYGKIVRLAMETLSRALEKNTGALEKKATVSEALQGLAQMGFSTRQFGSARMGGVLMEESFRLDNLGFRSQVDKAYQKEGNSEEERLREMQAYAFELARREQEAFERQERGKNKRGLEEEVVELEDMGIARATEEEVRQSKMETAQYFVKLIKEGILTVESPQVQAVREEVITLLEGA